MEAAITSLHWPSKDTWDEWSARQKLTLLLGGRIYEDTRTATAPSPDEWGKVLRIAVTFAHAIIEKFEEER